MTILKRYIVFLVVMIVLTGCGSSNSDMGVSQSMESARYANNAADSGHDIVSGSMAPSSLTSSNQNSTLQRKIIYSADVSMQIKDYDATHSAIRELITISEGYMLEFNENSNDREKRGTLTVKIPANNFESFLDQLQAMKPVVFRQNIQGQDVTEDYIDHTSRLNAKLVVEARLLDFMEKATTSNALLEFSNELARVQEDIEQLKGYIRYLEQNVAYSTISILMTERLDGKTMSTNPMFVERLGHSMNVSLNGMLAFFQGLAVFIVGALPIVIVASIIALPVWYGLRKHRRRKKVNKVTVVEKVDEDD